MLHNVPSLSARLSHFLRESRIGNGDTLSLGTAIVERVRGRLPERHWLRTNPDRGGSIMVHH